MASEEKGAGISMDGLRESAAAAIAGLEVAAVYLFGSRAKGTARSDSDYDIAVLFPEGIEALSRLDMTALIQDRLSRSLGAAADVIDLNSAPDILAFQVLRYGRLLIRRDEHARIGYEVALRKRYMDFDPYRRLYIARTIGQLARGE